MAHRPCLAFLADEILLSSDKTIAVIDGSGVLADPAGIDRQELVRLAKLRVPVENFNKSKLSKNGYLVRVEDQDVKLPCMSSIFDHLRGYRWYLSQRVKSFWMAPTSGTERTCDSRLICLSPAEDGEQDSSSSGSPSALVTQIGCRPEAVNISNVAALVDSEGKPHFKYIVEGANLFFTQQARFYLEKRKVILFKDSSANKGL